MAGTMNPLERKAKTSFLKGFLLAILIGILASIMLGYMLYRKDQDEKARIAALKSVVLINTDVKSGDEITPEMLTTAMANPEVANTGAITMQDYYKLKAIEGFDDSEPMAVYNQDGTLKEKKVYAKIDIPAKTILTAEMVNSEDKVVTSDLREVEYNMLVLPSNLEDGESVDVRLRLPSGASYTVLSKKRVTLSKLGEAVSDTTILLEVTEEQILTMNAAIVDAYRIKGSKLEVVKYTDPGLQKAATETYIPSDDVINLIVNDPNVVDNARNALIFTYNRIRASSRPPIDNALNSMDEDERKSSLESGVTSEITKQQTERKQYIDSIYGGIE